MSENTDKRTATQKIEDLEKVVTMLYTAVSQIKNATENLLKSQEDMGLVKGALNILNKKTEAIIQSASAESGITVDSVSALVVKMNVDELTAQVAGYVANGNLVSADEVSDNSFLVCEEYNSDGTLANPRIQFRLDSQDAATTEALKGKKVGESASFGENRFSAKVLEIYSIVEPASPEAAPAEPAPAAEAAPVEATSDDSASAEQSTDSAPEASEDPQTASA